MKYISLLIFALTFQPSASALHLYGKQVKKPCNSKYYLDNMAEKANQNVEQALTSTRTALLQAAKQALVGSAETDARRRLAYNVNLEHTIKLATTALDTLITNWKQLQSGLAAVNQLAATNALVAEVEQTTMKDVAVQTVGGTQAPPALATEAALKGNEHGYCLKQPGQPDRTEAADDSYTITKSIKTFVLKAAAKATGSTANDFNQVCAISVAGVISPSTLCTSTYTAVGFKGGKILQATAVTITKKNKADGEAYEAAISPDSAPSAATLTKLTTDIAGLETALKKIPKTMVNDADAALTSEATKDAIARTLAGTDASYSKKTKEVDGFIEKTFGKDGEKLKEQLTKNLKDMIPSKEADGGDGTTKLENLNDINKLIKAHRYYAIKNYIADQEEKKKKQGSSSCPTKTEKPEEPKKSAEECKKHTTEKPCKDEKVCDFDEKKDPKCFSKVETDKKNEKSFSRIF
uniref:Variant surface glycoprotein 1125.1176 n=1 Tax=Trypanosoma brucei TaxID=5691 RepID=A0A1J0R6E7_9TRYP|nr:variant surface glycoprotein 1125.1176 [Trypanosoma brucei]